MKRWLAMAAGAAAVLGLAMGSGCRSTSGMIPESGLPPLRVGVSPDYPPVIYRQGSDIVGLEADLAKALAEELGISSRAVEKQINLLKKDAKLVRIGSARGGYWEVIK